LKPGESKDIVFQLNKSDFAYYDSEMNYVVEGGDFNILVGNSSRDEDLKDTNFNVEKTFYLRD
jgi:beta-glucosidase